MNDIAATAHIDPEADLGPGVRVGPGAFVGAGVSLGADCEIGPNASVLGPARVGAGCRIFPGAVVGAEAQVVGLGPVSGGVEIGPGTIVRETATIHRSMYPEQNTVIGQRCYVMVGAHVGHDCRVGDEAILVNHCSLGGHVQVGRGCFLSNFVGVHQHVHVGEGSIAVGPAALRKDVPPFVKMAGNPPRVVGLNVVGLRRRGVSAEVRAHLKSAYHVLFDEAGVMAEKVEKISARVPLGAEIQSVIDFVQNSGRGIYQGRV